MEASSGFESLEINLSCLKENFEFALKHLENLLLNPRFEEKILEKLKINALGELASKNSDFDYLAKICLIAKFLNVKNFKVQMMAMKKYQANFFKRLGEFL